MRPSTRIQLLIGAGALGLLVWLQWLQPSWLTRLDETWNDALLRWHASEAADDRLLVVDIGEDSLTQLGRWPWPRARLADLSETLLAQGARAVALDMVLPEPADAVGDARLAVLAENAPLVLAQVLDGQPREPLLKIGQPAGAVLSADVQQPWTTALGYVANHAGLQRARCVGNVSYSPDADGVLRHLPLWTRLMERLYPNLELALLACAGQVISASQPLSEAYAKGLWRVPFQRTQQAYTVVQAADVLAQRVPDAWVQGRLVLVGSTALSLSDRVSTPLAPLTSGLMVHAQALSGWLDAKGAIPAPEPMHRGLWLAWVLLSYGGLLWLLGQTKPWTGLGAAAGVALIWAIWRSLVPEQMEASRTAYLMVLGGLLLTAMPYQWWLSQKRFGHLRTTLLHYVAPSVVHAIERQGLAYSLEPILRTVSVLVVDMQDYTAHTASLSLNEAGALTRGFLECVTQPVLDLQGTIDKYTGDGLVAFWGAPLPCADQTDRAVQAGLEMLRRVQAWNAQREAAALAPIRARIGIERGPAMVGDLGSSWRSTYTAVGDCINFAARLEAAARDLPADLVIGPQAQQALREYPARSLGNIKLRGVNRVLEVFTVDAPAPAPPAHPDQPAPPAL